MTKRFSTFEKKFRPLLRADATILWETYGEDLERIIRTPHDRIWTVVDCDGKLMIVAGYHLVNRMNYIISQKPWGKKDRDSCYRY